MITDSLECNLRQVRSRIQAACIRAHRAPDQVELIAVSKKQPADAIRAVRQWGQRAFGESYVQEALDKMALLADLDIEWHFIGRVQANKTRQIATHFDWLHSLVDPAHARRLSEQRPVGAPPLNVCLEVNLSGESSKAGVAPAAVAELLAICADLPGLHVRGLMTLPAPVEDEAAQRQPFQSLRALRDQLATPTRPLSCLSMGMSDDLESAILEGATFVRIGTAVFGPRSFR
jgi:hypothetical protein